MERDAEEGQAPVTTQRPRPKQQGGRELGQRGIVTPNTRAACGTEKLLLWLSEDTMPSVARGGTPGLPLSRGDLEGGDVWYFSGTILMLCHITISRFYAKGLNLVIDADLCTVH